MIKFQNVFYTYSPNTPYECHAIKDINLEINDGDFLFIVGQTGSGKSTIIQHMNGLLIPNKGEVLVDDYVLTSDKKKRTKKIGPLRKKVGVVFQFSDNQLFEETVLKDVAFGPLNFKATAEEAQAIAKEALAKVGLDENYYERSPFELSGGEKRKASIAGILALNPDILVLDEPTSGLDNSSRDEIMKLFISLNKEGKTIVIVSHDMNLLLQYGTKAIIVNDGKIIDRLWIEDLFYKEHDYPFLEMPPLSIAVTKLIKEGHKLNTSRIKNIDDLILELKKEQSAR